MTAPKGKHIFGTVKVGTKGQIVIPKEARDVFNIQPGDTLLMMGDEQQGIALVKQDLFFQFANDILNAKKIDEEGEDE
ncbi:MAG: AbrB/MazE/SpoVT family DNA-binding domain-containing protein [Staphylococcus equorum]|uniref:AbrB/MazE/SpoVT family DNA-binding domain-containing protein n=1 Tax=Staphylococcus TaxID=1279 RepID=UPI001EE096EB|nr:MULTISPECIES: AbrB/MazE/SpoVT family DNA-binding domain-containing protein [Staphylococcus]MDN6166104.1 AbrB/MazE/SpoVT family DNA-binding domain-containing protein [Tetragenococcus koreensis]MDN6572531.1 AbrB/MazE/SpoVT family DNA-binding domain-containing protein [Staphylococcus equorum]MDN6640652.1 AbrB/MazE/SpoVT family DNA-binding domain-containing protein [Tetragenococcus sp.]MCP8713981.1 AbrB/MazE/SpoVT family DNA-binding domain-containing protein [Staphylococcus arlettae]MDN6268669.